MSATAERDARGLALRLVPGAPLVITAGIAAPEVGKMYARALTLAQQSSATAFLCPVLRGLWEFDEVRGALAKAHASGEKLLTLARQTQGSTLFLIAHSALADTLLWHGDFVCAREHAEQGVAAYIPAQHRSLAFLYGGHDSSVWRVLALWRLGYPNQAVLNIHKALPLLETLAHPYSTVHTLNFTAILHKFLRQERAVHERVASALMLSQEQRFTQYVAMQIGVGLDGIRPRRKRD